jgi:hypothetical protein
MHFIDRLGMFAAKTRFRRPEKRPAGDLSAAAWGPTSSPHADFCAFGAFFRLARARPAPMVFFANTPQRFCAFMNNQVRSQSPYS